MEHDPDPKIDGDSSAWGVIDPDISGQGTEFVSINISAYGGTGDTPVLTVGVPIGKKGTVGFQLPGCKLWKPVKGEFSWTWRCVNKAKEKGFKSPYPSGEVPVDYGPTYEPMEMK